MRLRVLTYNIHRAIGVDRRFRLDRIATILSHHDPDVAILQEVDDGAPRSGHINLAAELALLLGYPHLAVGHNVRLRQGRYGNATLSRHPIVHERNIDLTIGGRKRRGCLHATIRALPAHGSPRDLEVFNLHLGLSARERDRQVAILARAPEFAAVDPGHALLLAGDFNDWRNLLRSAFVSVLGMRCATERAPDGRRCLRTYPSFSPTGGLDRVYLRGPVRALAARTCRLRAAKVASDHLPVIVDLELGPAATPRPLD
jgi:endonuclease/exonuclease/phosphatase family metal-dependent hydrolase